MNIFHKLLFIFVLGIAFLLGDDIDLKIEEALLYGRGNKGLYGVFKIISKKNDVENVIEYEYYSKGLDRSLIRFLSPSSINNQSGLLQKNNFWVYFPSKKKVVRIPSSLRDRPWMGTHLSYNDFARSTELINYEKKALFISNHIYKFKIIPLDLTPSIWGYETLEINKNILMRHNFFDQRNNLFKRIEVIKMGNCDDEHTKNKVPYPKQFKVTTVDSTDSFTLIETIECKFNIVYKDAFFSTRQMQLFR